MEVTEQYSQSRDRKKTLFKGSTNANNVQIDPIYGETFSEQKYDRLPAPGDQGREPIPNFNSVDACDTRDAGSL